MKGQNKCYGLGDECLIGADICDLGAVEDGAAKQLNFQIREILNVTELQVYQSSIAVVTSHHRLSGLKQHNFIILLFILYPRSLTGSHQPWCQGGIPFLEAPGAASTLITQIIGRTDDTIPPLSFLVSSWLSVEGLFSFQRLPRLMSSYSIFKVSNIRQSSSHIASLPTATKGSLFLTAHMSDWGHGDDP